MAIGKERGVREASFWRANDSSISACTVIESSIPKTENHQKTERYDPAVIGYVAEAGVLLGRMVPRPPFPPPSRSPTLLVCCPLPFLYFPTLCSCTPEPITTDESIPSRRNDRIAAQVLLRTTGKVENREDGGFISGDTADEGEMYWRGERKRPWGAGFGGGIFLPQGFRLT